MTTIDHWIVACIVPLAVWIVLSGLDDLLLDAAAVWTRFRRPPGDGGGEAEAGEEKRVAIFFPLWQEDGVAGAMIEHTIAAVRYQSYTLFAGCYPNDPATLAVVRRLAQRFSKLRLAVCPHDGPTSKADCLNWIYERMLAEEYKTGERFDIVLVHDAEDVIHSDSLRVMSRYCGPFDMVQLPVLPLSTGLREMTHGSYCDEFAESHGKDLPVRQHMGGFIPSAGVGTGYSRRAMEILAAAGGPFDRDCLTEDYANGLRLRQAGARQLFLPIRYRSGAPLATREYFPRGLRQAVRQRTRWIAGIALQTWERHGWGRSPSERYWFWRDRKGLVGNPVSLLSNILFLYGAVTGIWCSVRGVSWALAQAMPHPFMDWLLGATLGLLVLRTGIRAGFSARIYGWPFAAAVPIRAVWANWINGTATVCALAQYFTARVRRRRLAWIKTEHTYPPAAALREQRLRLGEILIAMNAIGPDEVRTAVARKDSLRLGEYLVRTGQLTEESLYSALSLQHGVPFSPIDLDRVPDWVRSLLPEETARKWNVVPYRVGFGLLFIAGPEVPSPEMDEELRLLTGMQIRFQLITPSDYNRLREPRTAAATAG